MVCILHWEPTLNQGCIIFHHLFIFLMPLFNEQRFFTTDEVQILFIVVIFVSSLKILQRYSPMLSSARIITSTFIYRSVLHTELHLWVAWVRESCLSTICWRVPFLLWIRVSGVFWNALIILFSLLWLYISIVLPKPHCLYYYRFMVSLEIRECEFSNWFSFIKIVLVSLVHRFLFLLPIPSFTMPIFKSPRTYL